jgi:hypothetical protein
MRWRKRRLGLRPDLRRRLATVGAAAAVAGLMAARTTAPAVPTGLSEREAARRIAAGFGNQAAGRVSRTLAKILRPKTYRRPGHNSSMLERRTVSPLAPGPGGHGSNGTYVESQVRES